MKITLLDPGSTAFLLLALFLSLGAAPLKAQNADLSPSEPEWARTLSVGSKLPAEVWKLKNEYANAPFKTQTLGAHKNKLLLLVFWSGGCATSVNDVLRAQDIAAQVGNGLKIVPVVKESASEFATFCSLPQGKKAQSVPTVINDRVLHRLFPHIGVPYIAWIKDGKLLNTTGPDQLTAENISDILNGRPSKLETVIHDDTSRPLFLSDSFFRYRDAELLKRSQLIKGYLNGLGSGGARRSSEKGEFTGRLFTNQSLADLYFSIGKEIFLELGEKVNFNPKRIAWEVKTPRDLRPDRGVDEAHYRRNVYSYELNIPPQNAGDFYHYMLEDLNRYTPYTISFENRPAEVFVLLRRPDHKSLATSGAVRKVLMKASGRTVLQNAPISMFVNMWNALDFIPRVIIDETGYAGNIDLNVATPKDLATARQELARIGLDLQPATRSLLMMVIKDRKTPNPNTQ